jgi:hypothetical protein
MIMKFHVPYSRKGVKGYDELFRCDLCSRFVEEVYALGEEWSICHDCYAMQKMFQKVKSKHR